MTYEKMAETASKTAVPQRRPPTDRWSAAFAFEDPEAVQHRAAMRVLADAMARRGRLTAAARFILQQV